MILVMWSGGLDSTGMLYKLLVETQEPLHVHHVDIQNIERRWLPERHAVSCLAQELRKVRDFKMTTNTYEFLQFKKFFSWDNDVVRFIAAQICKDNREITRLALGKCADDENPTFKVRAIQAMALWHACFIDVAFSPPEIIRPVANLNKKQIWEMLPEAIRNLTWSCRTPYVKGNSYSYCLQCKTCAEMISHGLLATEDPKDPTEA